MTLKMLDINNSVILIDEPEISLHPKWQQKIVKVYENIGENNQMIIATHSPHIVSSVKSESLKLLIKSEDGIEIIQGEDRGLLRLYRGKSIDRVNRVRNTQKF